MMSVVLLFCLVGCGKEKKSVLDKVRVCEVTHSIFYAPQYVAIEEGYFDEEGIDLTLINGGGADNTVTQLHKKPSFPKFFAHTIPQTPPVCNEPEFVAGIKTQKKYKVASRRMAAAVL